MSSSPSRVLRGTGFDLVPDAEAVSTAVPRVLRQPAVSGLDRHVRPSEEVAEEIHTVAFDEGFEAGRASAHQQLMSAANAMQQALETCRERLREEFEQQRTEIVELAIGLAEFVLGHANHDGGAALSARLREALELLDDQDLVIALNAGDIGLAETIDAPGMVVVADPDLAPGEARVTGEWARADLTHRAGIDILRASELG